MRTLVGRDRQRRSPAKFDLAVPLTTRVTSYHALSRRGVGKSRLAAEFLREVDATVVRGRCLSYGEGITYWPLVEVLRCWRPAERASCSRPWPRRPGDCSAVTERATAEETAFWRCRRLFEALAAERPLVAVLDDFEWAEPTFLDLIDHVADLSRDAPIFLLCVARPDLLEHAGRARPGEAARDDAPPGAARAGRARGPCWTISAPTSNRPFRATISTAADGNPLFVDDFAAMLRGRRRTPTCSLRRRSALLTARLDRLEAAERVAARLLLPVEGSGSTARPSRSSTGIRAPLIRPCAKELVRPDKGPLPC